MTTPPLWDISKRGDADSAAATRPALTETRPRRDALGRVLDLLSAMDPSFLAKLGQFFAMFSRPDRKGLPNFQSLAALEEASH